MTKEQNIRKVIDEELNEDNQGDYANLLNARIDENRKLMSRIFISLLFCFFTFPLITESKISVISFGPFKLSDNLIALGIIPSIFAFLYYKYITVWIDLVEQKMTYKIIIAKIFSIDQKSFLNQRLWSYSFLDSIMIYHLDEKSKFLGFLTQLFWVPIGLIIIFLPFLFEYYMVHTLYQKFGFDSILNKIIIVLPILIGVFTVLIFIQVVRKDLDKSKYFSKNKPNHNK